MKNALLIVAVLAFTLVGCGNLKQSSSKTTVLPNGIKLKLEKIPSNSITEPYLTFATYYIPADQKFVHFRKYEFSYEGQMTTRMRRQDDAYDVYTIASCGPKITIVEEKPIGEIK